MTDNFIQLNKGDVLRLEIRTSDGKSTGEFLEFDLEDIELPLKYQELIEKDKKNKENLKNQFLIIDKRQDVKGKKLMSKNEEDKIKALNDFFKKEEEIYNMFLGENGVKKLLNGRKLGWTSLSSIDEIIEKQIAPYLDLSMESITKKVREKYNQAKNRNKEVLE
jgi:GDP-D-mannose dehydratase